MREAPRLRVTKEYDLFEMHDLNRDLKERPILLASMKAHGFMPSSPIQCIRNGKGTLKVIRGHHRLHYAKRLKLPVWYVVDESSTDIYDLEADSGVRWDLRDFLTSRARAGDDACRAVLAFQRKHNLTQGVAISLMGGEGASSNNKDLMVKRGTFKVAPDITHAKAVVDVTDHFRSCGVVFATQSAFVKAVSMVLRVPECDSKVLKYRLAQAPALMQRRTNTDGYLEEIEALYNHGAKSKRLSLKFRAREVGRQRQSNFGRDAKGAKAGAR